MYTGCISDQPTAGMMKVTKVAIEAAMYAIWDEMKNEWNEEDDNQSGEEHTQCLLHIDGRKECMHCSHRWIAIHERKGQQYEMRSRKQKAEHEIKQGKPCLCQINAGAITLDQQNLTSHPFWSCKAKHENLRRGRSEARGRKRWERVKKKKKQNKTKNYVRNPAFCGPQ